MGRPFADLRGFASLTAPVARRQDRQPHRDLQPAAWVL